MKSSTKKGLLLIGGIGGLLLLLAAAMAVVQFFRVKDTLEEITQPSVPIRELGVYVLEDDPAQELKDTAGYSYGALKDEEGLSLLGQALGEEPAWEEYPTAFALADALRKGECRAVLLEEAYQRSLSDARGYEWTETGMRKVGSLQVEKEETVSLAAPEGEQESFLLYLSGNDTFGDVSTLSRSDVNILAAVNIRTKKMTLVATPRDFYVSFSQTGGAKDKLTHAGIYGVEASVDALENLYGLDISYYLRMNFTGFVEVVDALGGVSVYSDREFTVENIRTYEEGYNQLTGIEALAFARERMSFPEGDYQRAKNQMEVIRAVAEKASSPALLENLSKVLDAVEGNFQTNLPRDQILALAPALAGDWEISSYTTSGWSDYRETYSMPGAELYVILPDEASVEEAASLLKETLEGEE
jgi:LCP family protein required for cell wall assembly